MSNSAAVVRLPRHAGGPEPRAGYVSRPNLVGRLIRSQASVALIAAPAGYGKTTLATEWDGWDARPFAQVAVDCEHDESPGALVEAIEQALDDVVPREPRGRGAATRSRRASAAVGLARLARSLESRPPFVLLLDDLHVLRASASLEVVRTLARHVPSGSVLALVSRSEPALPLGRLRANRALTEVRADDLAMTMAEAVILLEMSGVKLSAMDAEELARKAEGWPAGIYLAALAMRDQPDPRDAVARFGGDDAIVADYVREEVLSQLAPESVEFLLRAALLDELSAPLCNAVLQRSDSAIRLEALGARDLLLIPLDRRRETYRCQRLLARALGAELRRSQPGEAARLHRRASDWYAAHADVDRAMHHAVAAGDAARAAGLLAGSAPEYVTQDRNGRMEDWLASFTPEQISAYPALSLAAANSQLLKGDLAAVQRLESSTLRVLGDTPLARRGADLEACAALLRAAVAGEGVAGMGTDAARAYALEPEDSPWRPLCCLLDGVSRHLTGDPDGAEERLLEGVRRGTIAAPNIQTLCLAQLALVAVDRDDWESAAGYSARSLSQVEHYALRDYPTSALVFAASAAVRARRGRVEEAQRDADEARRLLGLLTDFAPWYEVETRLALATAAIRLSDAQGARELVASAERYARRMPDAVVVSTWLERIAARLDAGAQGPSPLTTAELRILGFLPTHLSFREIADQLYVSANTVKTQAHAVYRKLDAASRSDAVTRATELGLLEF
jgi:LuxR family maltose regulon positive regulatory protein